MLIGVFLNCLVSAIIGVYSGFVSGKIKGMTEGAWEVYRGNTKLQYTIVDSVKVDSCVIFLNK